MDTSGGPGDGAAVEFRYGATRRDVREMLCVRLRKTPWGRREVLAKVLFCLPVPWAASWLFPGPDPSLPVLLGAGLVLGSAVWLYFMGRPARRQYLWASEYPEYRCVIDESGSRNHRPDGTSAVLAWEQYIGWTETRGLFVFLFTTGELGWLPKRGASTPADLDRARDLVGRRVRRL
ncbi:YcxB family protein [Streptomyces sp. NPDC001523]|uniref:YcxB family protein n=1 Tax=Streptomyces sp. NPDC001523 TaxID=3154383 RepID=UPI00332C39DE